MTAAPDSESLAGWTRLRIVRWPDRDRTARGPVLERWNEFREARLAARPEGERTMLAGVLDAIPRPDRFPAFADLVSSDSGEIWVGGYPGQLGLEGVFEERLRVPERRWRVLALDGDFLATAGTPEGFQPLIVAADRVWGVHTYELGVESVRAYAIQRR